MYAWHVKELNAISYKAVYFFNEPNWDNFTSHLDLGQYEDLHVRRVLMVEIAHGTVHYQHLCRGHFPKSPSSKKVTRISQAMFCVLESWTQYANVGLDQGYNVNRSNHQATESPVYVYDWLNLHLGIELSQSYPVVYGTSLNQLWRPLQHSVNIGNFAYYHILLSSGWTHKFLEIFRVDILSALDIH